MNITRRVALIVVPLFIFVDLFLCSLFYIENDYIPNGHGGGDRWPSYDIRTSQLEHCFLCLIRASLLCGGLIGVLRNPTAATERISRSSSFIACVFLTIAAYSLFKLLALAETTNSFRLPWFWSLFGWNLFASTVSALIWTNILAKMKTRSLEIRVNENGTISDEAGLVENDALGNRDHSTAVDRDQSKECTKENKGTESSEEVTVRQATSQLWRLLRYTKPDLVWYLLGFTFLIFFSVARVFIPYYTGQVISDIVVEHSYARLLQSVLTMSGLAVGSALFAGLRGASFQYAISKMGIRIRRDLFSSLVKQDIGFFDTTKTGLNINIFLRSGIMVLGTLAFMVKLSWQLTIMTFISMPVIGVLTKLYGQFYERLAQEGQDSLAKANAVAEEVLSSMKTVRSFANEAGECKRYNAKLMDVMAVRKKQTYALLGYMWITELYDLVLLVAVLWYGGYLVLEGRLKSDDLIAYLLYQLQLGESLSNIGWVFTGLMQAVGASTKVFEWIDHEPTIPNDGKEVLEEVTGRVEFKDVAFSYPSRPNIEVLKGISFKAEPGEVVALVGPSGGGKSSCIALLEHFYEPKFGVVSLDGIPVQRFDHSFFHRVISLVGQEPVLFARSIRENISYGLEDNEWTEEDVAHASKLANAHDFIDGMPAAYDTDVGEKGLQLSGGQKQRIAIARSLIRKPKVLLLDEATSALDAESEYLVKQAIHQNLSGHTVLLIAHRLSTVEKANKIVVIDKGRVVQQGTHAQLLEQDGLYRNLVHRQLLGDQESEHSGSFRTGLLRRSTRIPPVATHPIMTHGSSVSQTRIFALSI